MTSKHSKKLVAALQKHQESLETLEYIYSDDIEKYDVKLNKKRQILVMTNKNLYIFDPKDMSLVSHQILSNIHQILQITSNQSLLVLKMENHLDLFVETIKRNKFMVYILENAEK